VLEKARTAGYALFYLPRDERKNRSFEFLAVQEA
jgi:hypothetical protein